MFFNKEWQGLVLDFHVYSPLIRGYCKSNDFANQGDLAKESSDLNQLRTVMYSKVFAALSLVGNMERSLFV